MKKCILCNKETEGSIGAAGIRWPFLCQECKDKEDKILSDRIVGMSKVLKTILKEGV